MYACQVGNYDLVDYLSLKVKEVDIEMQSLLGRNAVQILTDGGFISAAENLNKIASKREK